MSEEYEVEEEIHPTAAHFEKPISEIELGKKLAYYHELCTEIEAMEASKAALRKEILEAGKGEESIMGGGYACFFKKVAGRSSCDWKTAYKDAVGAMPEKDVAKYITRGEESVRIEVKKLST
jgi:hypothetical protein